MLLTPTTVFLGKSEKRGTKSRSGFKDESGQVFIPPSRSNRLEFWKKKMGERGYSF